MDSSWKLWLVRSTHTLTLLWFTRCTLHRTKPRFSWPGEILHFLPFIFFFWNYCFFLSFAFFCSFLVNALIILFSSSEINSFLTRNCDETISLWFSVCVSIGFSLACCAFVNEMVAGMRLKALFLINISQRRLGLVRWTPSERERELTLFGLEFMIVPD